MKKSIYFALAALTLALFACTSKPADADQQPESQPEQVELTVEQPAPAEPAAEPAAESLDSIAEPAADAPAEDQLAEELPAPEQPADQPAEEPAAPEQPAAEAPAAPSDKYEVARSDGNFVAFKREIVTADSEGCIDIDVVFDKKFESNVRLIVAVDRLNGKRVGLVPFAVAPGGTKSNYHLCASVGGVFSSLTPGEQYKLSFHRAVLQ